MWILKWLFMVNQLVVVGGKSYGWCWWLSVIVNQVVVVGDKLFSRCW